MAEGVEQDEPLGRTAEGRARLAEFVEGCAAAVPGGAGVCEHGFDLGVDEALEEGGGRGCGGCEGCGPEEVGDVVEV